MGSAFFHDTYRGRQGDLGIGLIVTEWNICYDKGSFPGPDYTLCMIDHLVERDRQGSGMTGHYIAGAVAYQYDINTRLIEDPGKRIIVRGDHRYLLTSLLHLLNSVGSDFLNIPGFLVIGHFI